MGVRKISSKLVFIKGFENPMREIYSRQGWSGGCMTLQGQYFYRN